ncbi:YbfB/YjiJ family MFS transporter [Micromonospora sp. WMMC241]|uniref:MFS transporter n=1 Tax=Micromonospora sp. WMMC241 TaxID=3015159 RepID=UPI0022B65F2D|nr:MFS transporter [Micromonospora sp. WMMC241]MCZ7438780.1 YbfB/YjiJ family MFS transporter [Micromonospora sp. WMMC241]
MSVHRPVKSETLGLACAGLSLIAVCYGLARFAYGLFVPVFRAEFGLDAAATGAIASSAYVSYCLAIVAATVLTPRLGGRALAVLAGCAATTGTLLIAVAPNATVLTAGVIVAGSSTGVASPPLAHAVARAVAAPVRNRTQTVVNAGTGVGVAVAGPIALLTYGQWRTGWFVFAVVCAAVTGWVARAVPAARSAGGPAAPLPRPLLPAGSGRLVAAAALTGVASAATWTFGRDLLVTVGGMNQRPATLAWVLLGALGVLGAVAGDLAGRVGIGGAWLLTTSVLAAATGLLAAVPGEPAVASVAAGAFGAAYIALTGLLLIWGTRVYPRTPAAGVGVAFLVLALGQAAGASLVGAAAEAVGLRSAFAVAALVAALGAALRPHPR